MYTKKLFGVRLSGTRSLKKQAYTDVAVDRFARQLNWRFDRRTVTSVAHIDTPAGAYLHVFLHMRLTMYIQYLSLYRLCRGEPMASHERGETYLSHYMFVSMFVLTRTGTSGRVRFSYIKKVGKKI